MHSVLLVQTGLCDAEALASRITESGFDVRLCSTIAAAVRSIRDDLTPDFLIVSESAGEGDTLGVLDRLHREFPDIRTMALIDSTDTLDQSSAHNIDRLLSATASDDLIIQTLSQMSADATVDETLEHSQSFISAMAQRIETDADVGAVQVELLWKGFLEIQDCLAVWVSTYDESSGQLVPETVFGLGTDIQPEPVDVDTPTDMAVSSQQVETGAAPRYQTRVPIVGNDTLLGAVSFLSTRELSQTESAVIQALCRTVFESQDNSEMQKGVDTNTSTNRYAQTLSHEIRNHLQIAWSALDGLESEGEEDQDIVDALEGIESATQEAEFIADPSLDPSDLEPTSLRTVAEAAWDRTDSGDGELNVSLPNSDRVIADPTTLELLFANLFRNGVEHGDGNVVVETVEEDGSSGFAVTDSGPGIPDVGQERIFEWGFAHDDDTGVGLAIVREVVDSHGWEITAKTGPDGGARFEITNVTFT